MMANLMTSFSRFGSIVRTDTHTAVIVPTTVEEELISRYH